MKMLAILFGFIIAGVAIWSAIALEFKHFYEFLLSGLLLILVSWIPKEILTTKRVLKMWVLFFIAGVVVDLLLTLLITKGWYYNYSDFWEYALLYVWVYPAGGLVLVFSYVIIKRLLGIPKREDKKISLGIFWIPLVCFLLLTIFIFFLKEIVPSGVWGYLFFASVLCTLVLLVPVVAEFTKQNSYIHELFLNPLPVVLSTVIATYMNLLIHEYPNVYAKQWVYAVNTGTFLDSLVLGIPVMIWFLWPFLTIGSLTIFYRTIDLKK